MKWNVTVRSTVEFGYTGINENDINEFHCMLLSYNFKSLCIIYQSACVCGPLDSCKLFTMKRFE